MADARAQAQAPETPSPDTAEAAVAFRRDRLLSGLLFVTTIALLLGAPFALRAGAVFFMPVTVAVVVAIALAPAVAWLEARRVPSGLAAMLTLIGFLILAVSVAVAIVWPATQWVALLPSKLPRIRANLAPLIDAFTALERLFDRLGAVVGSQAGAGQASVVVDTPNSATEILTRSAPGAFFQAFFAVLLVFFLLAAFSRMRAHTIHNRASFGGALRTARLIRDAVNYTASYLATIAIVNFAIGAAVSAVMWLLGMPTPLMWGGLAALFNFIPYVGPVIVTAAIALGGLVHFADPWTALTPAAAFLLIHAVEANLLTPAIVGRRLTINPLAIILSVAFWGWVWGTVGALISVPLLIIGKAIVDHAGAPDIMGFVLDEGILVDEAAPLGESEK